MDFGLCFGALSPTLQKQIKNQNLKFKGSKESLECFQQDFIDITRLHIRGYLSDSATKAARLKLLNRVAKEVVVKGR